MTVSACEGENIAAASSGITPDAAPSSSSSLLDMTDEQNTRVHDSDFVVNNGDSVGTSQSTPSTGQGKEGGNNGTLDGAGNITNGTNPNSHNAGEDRNGNRNINSDHNLVGAAAVRCEEGAAANDNANGKDNESLRWDEAFEDANELESLVFCIRRPTARKRLFLLVNNLRLLAGKLKRHEEVTQHLDSEKEKQRQQQQQKLAERQSFSESSSSPPPPPTTSSSSLSQRSSNNGHGINPITSDTHANHTNANANANATTITNTNKRRGKKRPLEDCGENGNGHGQKASKMPRAIPLESMTKEEREIIETAGGKLPRIENASQPPSSTSNTNSNTDTHANANSNSNSNSSLNSQKNDSALAMMPNSFDPLAKPPLLKLKDNWVHHHNRGSRLHCPDFDATNKCPLGSKCTHLHVYIPRIPNLTTTICQKAGVGGGGGGGYKGGKTPAAVSSSSSGGGKGKGKGKEHKRERVVAEIFSKDDLERAYEKYRHISLTKTNIAEKIKNDALNNPNYSCCFICPIDSTVYYAQPFPGDKQVKANKSSQGIWWYRTMKEAKDAVSTIVIRDLQHRGIVPTGAQFRPRAFLAGNGNGGNGKTNHDRDAGKKMAIARAAQMARKALVSNDIKCSVIKEKNIGPPILPEIKPWNWMETHYGERCTQFNTPQGCPFGCSCSRAHVYFPKFLNNQQFPRREALPAAYMANFGLVIEDSFFQGTVGRSPNTPFRIVTAIDNRGQMWYTAALKCPREGTIYYAAGGNTGMLNKQNMVLYPRVEDAKLAVAGVVLDAFVARGLKGDRNASGNMNTSMNLPPHTINNLDVRVGTGMAMGMGVMQPGQMIGIGGQQQVTMQTVPPPMTIQTVPITTHTHILAPAPAPPPPPTIPNAMSITLIPPPPPPPPPPSRHIANSNHNRRYRDNSFLKSYA